jgi:hypothetical protein
MRDMAVGMCSGCGNERNACACDSGGLLEMRKHMAFLRLINAAKALLAENTEIAQGSYNEPGTRFTDAQWKKEDPENFKLCREVRNSLREAARALPQNNTGGGR